MCWHPLARKLQRSQLMSDTTDPQEAPRSGLLQPRLVLLLDRWEAEVQGWIHAADIAEIGDEKAVAMRNRVRADTIRECRKELLKICQQNEKIHP